MICESFRASAGVVDPAAVCSGRVSSRTSSRATASNAAAPSASAAILAVLGRAGGGPLPAETSSARTSSAALPNRSSGVLASARAIASDTAGRDAAGRVQRRWGLGEVLRDDRLGVGAGEGRAAGQHLVEHAAERIDVARASTPAVPVACSGLM